MSASSAAAEFGWAVSNETGAMVHVDEVPRGARANVVCPGCRKPMISKQGNVIRWHFAHETRDRQCNTAPETAVHRAAKDILSKMHGMNMGAAINGPAAIVPFEHIGNEVQVRSWRVDSMIRNGTGEIAIEFCVTHPCEADKIHDFRNWGQGLLEVTIGSYSFADRHGLTVAIASAAPRKWLSFPGYTRARA